jgi:glycosyltransferase involved in cell wall biosynthesis
MSGPRGHLVTRSRWPAAFEAGTVGETVRSLCDQTCPAAEIVVVDDCSTDETADAAEAAGATIVSPTPEHGLEGGSANVRA